MQQCYIFLSWWDVWKLVGIEVGGAGIGVFGLFWLMKLYDDLKRKWKRRRDDN